MSRSPTRWAEDLVNVAGKPVDARSTEPVAVVKLGGGLCPNIVEKGYVDDNCTFIKKYFFLRVLE